MIAVNALVFAVELSVPGRELERPFHVRGIVPERYTYPEWIRWDGFRPTDY